MNILEKRLDQFSKGEISSEILLETVKTFAGVDVGRVTEMKQALATSFQAKKLPAEVYFLLDSELNRASITNGGVGDDERTRMANPARGRSAAVAIAEGFNGEDTPDDDETRLSRAPIGTEATRIARRVPPAAEQGVESLMPTALAGATLGSRTTGAGPSLPEESGAILGIGSVLKDRFVLEDVIGSGGMGVVYKALDLRKQEAKDKFPYVALKVLSEDFEKVSSSLIALQREAKKAQLLAHPNIITVYDFDRDGTHVFMSMEILNGQSLDAFIKSLPPGGLPFKRAWYIVKGLCLALAYAHKKGIIHSDFKPSNVFITEESEVKVLDFGIACAVSRHGKEGDETVFNARDLGALTPAYASLEMFGESEPDPRDDVYALGCVIYEILTGKHPYGKLTAVKARELELQPRAVPGLSRRQWRGLQRALAFERKDRTPTVDRLLTDIQPSSPISWALSVTLVAALGAGGYAAYLYQNQGFEEGRNVIVLTPEQKQEVQDFLELAGIHFEVGYLTAPTGSNAAWAYRQALSLDPYNEEAVAGLKRIAGIMEKQALELYGDGRYEEALAKVEEGLEVMPTQKGLLDLQERIIKR